MTAPAGEENEPARPDDSALRRLIDVGVFAPLGFLLEYRSVVPKLTEAGKRQIDFTRSLGRAALRTIARGASTRRNPPPALTLPPAATTPPALTPAPAATLPSAMASSSDPTADDRRGGSAIDGYHAMTAREIVARVADTDLAGIAWITETETAGKARVTVLRATAARRARLQGDR